MAQTLPIRQTPPAGRVTRPEEGVPVMATVRWGADGSAAVLARVTAWSTNAVEISWVMPGVGPRTDWIAAADVSRTPPSFPAPADPPVARPRTRR